MNSPRPSHAAPAEPLYERIRLALREGILAGHHVPGIRVPSESALGQLKGASRITVSQAMSA